MGKFRVKQHTKCIKKRRGFCGTKEKKDVNTNDFINSANNVNTDAPMTATLHATLLLMMIVLLVMYLKIQIWILQHVLLHLKKYRKLREPLLPKRKIKLVVTE